MRVLDTPDRPERNAALIILGWMSCAARPFRWREIQARFCIDIANELCDPKSLLVKHGKMICGSFVDLDDGDDDGKELAERTVRFVHPSARRSVPAYNHGRQVHSLTPLKIPHQDQSVGCTTGPPKHGELLHKIPIYHSVPAKYKCRRRFYYRNHRILWLSRLRRSLLEIPRFYRLQRRGRGPSRGRAEVFTRRYPRFRGLLRTFQCRVGQWSTAIKRYFHT